MKELTCWAVPKLKGVNCILVPEFDTGKIPMLVLVRTPGNTRQILTYEVLSPPKFLVTVGLC
jgi:hypothetical protein